jgi:hypothetical protein
VCAVPPPLPLFHVLVITALCVLIIFGWEYMSCWIRVVPCFCA